MASAVFPPLSPTPTASWRHLEGCNIFFVDIFPNDIFALPCYVFWISIHISLCLKCAPRLCSVNMWPLMVFYSVNLILSDDVTGKMATPLVASLSSPPVRQFCA